LPQAAQFIDENVDCDFVDINCGCPLDEVPTFVVFPFMKAKKYTPLKPTWQGKVTHFQ